MSDKPVYIARMPAGSSAETNRRAGLFFQKHPPGSAVLCPYCGEDVGFWKSGPVVKKGDPIPTDVNPFKMRNSPTDPDGLEFAHTRCIPDDEVDG